MKFQLAVNVERMSDQEDMREVRDHTLEMVQMADQTGFRLVWSAEHHALEMTIAPNPFQLLTWWASHTEKIRLGTGVAVAPYWHPIRLAGEAAMTDLISDGRLEFGIGSGAYQREFDRMAPGLKQSDAYRYVHEMLPALKALWAGDYEHNGEFWSFPKSTSVPKPLQQPHPPIWVAARSPITFDYAVENNLNIISWPLTRPIGEIELYQSNLEASLKKYPKAQRQTFAIMRHTAIYSNSKEADKPVQAVQRVLGQFENLMRKLGDVRNGFPDQIDLSQLQERDEFNADMLTENLMFGTPDEVIKKLKHYESLGVDEFVYYASMGLDKKTQKNSLKLFCEEVLPAFR
jgi:alkanesulfonate monooxygenase SsuD/methylene tetrahydromethanopterin reductase-like flavin-dependent oxidoreductase (luciferase family)